jgi:hypothetical protein
VSGFIETYWYLWQLSDLTAVLSLISHEVTVTVESPMISPAPLCAHVSWLVGRGA